MLRLLKNVDRFEENKCRICRKMSCCVACRRKHEMLVHSIQPDCNICIFGRTFLQNPSDCLLSHIKENHWPLHCVKCKIIFQNTNELVTHTKCSYGKQTQIIPIIINATDATCETPEVTDYYKSNENVETKLKMPQNIIITTSTPTQEEGNNFIHNISFVSPVESLMRSNDETKKLNTNEENALAVLAVEKSSYQNLKMNENSKDTTQHGDDISKTQKRRVTFSKTQIQTTKAQMTKNVIISRNKQFTLNVPECSTIEYTQINNEFKSEAQNSHNQTTIKSVEINNTFWITATNFTPNTTIPVEIKENYDITANYSQGKYKNMDKICTRKPVGIWSSVANLVKTIMQGLSGPTSSQNERTFKENKYWHQSLKRMRTSSNDSLDDIRIYKKIKLSDIKARKPIHELRSPYKIPLKNVRMCDKSTQTD